jgi:hypothetical protein
VRRAFEPRTWIIFATAFVVYVICSGFAHATFYNNYVLLANGWLDGHVWIDHPSSAIDALGYMGHYYIIEAPMPAVLMLPLVAIFRTDANQTFVAVICAAALVAALDVALDRMTVAQPQRTWLLVFAGLGTVLWWCASFPAVWMFAHIAGAMFLTFFLAEWYGHRRPWLLGLLIACAALSRFPIVLAAIPFAWWLWVDSPPDKRVRSLLSAVAAALPLFILYAAYNEARWHTMTDVGYTLWYHQDQVGQPTGSPLRLQYLPFNLYSFLLLAPQFEPTFPWIHPTGLGVSLTLTSPALVLALGAPRSRETTLLALAAGLVAVPSLLYYVNGFEQFGMRHAMDFLPPLILLCARGVDRFPSTVVLVLIGLSVAANAYGEWYSWAFHGFTVVPVF